MNILIHIISVDAGKVVQIMNDSCFALLVYGDDQVLLGHQAIFSNVACEPPTEVCLRLKFIVQRPVMVVGVREDSVYPSRNRAQSLYGVLLDCHTAWKVLVAVQEGGSSVKCV